MKNAIILGLLLASVTLAAPPTGYEAGLSAWVRLENGRIVQYANTRGEKNEALSDPPAKISTWTPAWIKQGQWGYGFSQGRYTVTTLEDQTVVVEHPDWSSEEAARAAAEDAAALQERRADNQVRRKIQALMDSAVTHEELCRIVGRLARQFYGTQLESE